MTSEPALGPLTGISADVADCSEFLEVGRSVRAFSRDEDAPLLIDKRDVCRKKRERIQYSGRERMGASPRISGIVPA